ncbi:hypothetical protein K461DRAFT_275905 [Myriangium duriaei CBS 260.36]|uniref:Uncharacterized protein n=1 Tax=Myriangium duriaei CBS 260.36 TaxID=1168546 RepID=A0A9P4J613_9PEZI|nr:hypothetical protein K461DRAFT_275905 [Myriangium duriaei CBS 260.36]
MTAAQNSFVNCAVLLSPLPTTQQLQPQHIHRQLTPSSSAPSPCSPRRASSGDPDEPAASAAVGPPLTRPHSGAV